MSKENNIKEIGEFEVINKSERENLEDFKLNKTIDYLIAFNYYMRNGFLFEAFNILEKAKKAYPDTKFIEYLIKEINKSNNDFSN